MNMTGPHEYKLDSQFSQSTYQKPISIQKSTLIHQFFLDTQFIYEFWNLIGS